MALRKQVAKDANKIPPGNQQIGNMQEEDDDDGNADDELSSSLLSPLVSRDKRRREKENKSKPKEMTEEEMMDLALRLSEQEASITALRQQKEEEAMMQAIQESMDSQTQSSPSSQGLLDDAEAPLRICSRRKLVYSNGRPIAVVEQRASGDGCTPRTDLNRGAKRSGDSDAGGFLGPESNVGKKPRRKDGGPLLETPDVSQTQKIDSRASSPCSSDVPDLLLDSQQSSDSTHIEDCPLRKSPVFPLTGCRAEVRVPRLTQDLLQTCRTSGFVCCSQDSSTLPQGLSPARPKSPTFPQSRALAGDLASLEDGASPKSPLSSETEQGGDGRTSPEYVQSPVFGWNAQREKSPSACKPQAGVCNSGFTFSSQESLASSPRSTACRPKSPVFPRSPGPPSERSAGRESPVDSETDGGPTGRRSGRRASPASGGTGRRICLDAQKRPAGRLPAELGDSGARGTSDASEGPSRRPRPRRKPESRSDPNPNVLDESSEPGDGREKLKETSKGPESEGTLFWSEEDDDVTPLGSPSPVFPEERPAHRAAGGRPASPDHRTAASPGTTPLSRPSSSPPSADRRQLSATQREPIGSRETVGGASAPAASTVHYYWGVPFCPRGLDPDDYTQVILAQMEVYEKSLKRAQRCLLRKAEWGEAVLPQTEKSPSSESPAQSPQQLFPQRRGLRLRGKKPCDAGDPPPAEADDKEPEEAERENAEEGKRSGGGGERPAESDDCEICPETQLSDDGDCRTQNVMTDAGRGAEPRPKSPELLEVEPILQNDSAAEDEQRNEVEVEVDEDQKMKGNTPVRSGVPRGQHARAEEVEEDGKVPDVVEIKDRGLQRSTSPELEVAVIPRNPGAGVDCPICQGSFPPAEIEMHAAYCDGDAAAFMDTRRTKAESFQASLKPRRKRTRKAEATAEEPNDAADPARNQEKCYICQKLVPLRDYSRHTELCFHRQGSKTARENLLSALEKSESRNSGAGPSGSKLQPGDVIDLRDDDEDDDDCAPGLRVSNSPIRSFTPISEATDCLIDFKKQYRTKKLSQRPR